MSPNHDGKHAGEKPGWSIQRRLVLLLCILLFPTLIIQVYVYFDRFENRRAEELQANLEVARAAAKSFEAYIMDVVHTELVIGLALPAHPVGSRESDRILRETRDDNPAILDVFWMEPGGAVVGASSKDYLGLDFSDRSFREEIKNGREWAIGELTWEPGLGKPGFIIGRGIRNAQHQLLGIVGAMVEPDLLDSALGIERAKGAAVSIIDNTGRLVFRYPRIYPSWDERNLLARLPQLRKALNGVEYAWVGATIYKDAIGIVANVPIRGIGWLAAADLREKEALAAIRATLLPQTIFFLVLTVVAFSAALAFSREISASIAKLTMHARALGRGETHDSIAVSGAAELHELAGAFNKMAEDIALREQERTRAEIALRESEEHFRLLFEKSPVGAALVDLDHRFKRVNESFCKMVGYSEQELLSLRFTDITHTNDQQKSLSVLRKLACGETDYFKIEKRYIRKDGAVIWASTSVRVMCNAEGSPLQFMPIVEDITERKLMEEELYRSRDELELRVWERTAELTESRERYQKLYSLLRRISDNVPDMIWVKDMDDRFLFVNKAMCDKLLLCSTPDEAVGKTALFFSELERSAGKEHVFGDLCGSDLLVKQTRMPGRFLESGNIRDEYLVLDVYKAPFYSESGELIGTVGCGRDITKEKTIEDALRKSEEQHRLLSAKLISVQEEERKRIGAEIHDSIGQTLAAVKFWVETALQFRKAGNDVAALDHLQNFIPTLQQSIEETRNIYMGLRPSMLEDMGLLATLEWYRRECMRLFPQRHIELETRIAEEDISDILKICIFRITQEALNNVARHSQAEWVDISVSRNEHGIQLVVSDDGVGMDLDQILQRSSARGLGLSGMKERAELAGGTFSIESSPGEGTTIRCIWPVSDSSAEKS